MSVAIGSDRSDVLADQNMAQRAPRTWHRTPWQTERATEPLPTAEDSRNDRHLRDRWCHDAESAIREEPVNTEQRRCPLGHDVTASAFYDRSGTIKALLATVNGSDLWEGRWHERLRWGPPPSWCRGLSAVADGTSGKTRTVRFCGDSPLSASRCRSRKRIGRPAGLPGLSVAWRPLRRGHGRMTRGPQGFFAKIPGSDAGYRLLTRVLPLGRGVVVEREGNVFVR